MPTRRLDKVWTVALAGALAGCAPTDPAIRAPAAAVTRTLAPGLYRFGTVDVRAVAERGRLAASVVAAPVDPRALPSATSGVVPIDTLAPFPVDVDLATARIVHGPVTLPPRAWPLVAGARVTLDGRPGRILRVDADGVVFLPEPG